MGTARLDTIGDCVKHDLDIEIRCMCGRVEVFEAQELYLMLIKAGKSVKLHDAHEAFRCKRCKRKSHKLQPVPRF